MAGRSDLLAWLNELLQINYTKIEQCGTGAAYCQVLDSIYGDIPMNRVKFNAKHEYEFIANFKVMQNVFKSKKIEKPIPVEKLVKCKMQDNLEFLQWMKRFWDSNYGGQGYDAITRRKGAPAEPPATIAPLSTGRSSSSGSNSLRVDVRSGGRTPLGHRAASAGPSEVVHQLQAQVKEMQTHLEGLEKERDFYFAKLRDIELLVQAQLDSKSETKVGALTEIQQILYSTEDGFEVPDANAATGDEEETY
ncbi:hypothetical protein APHAL10511_002340 [Amanita phalloides]|nr:hypothetical protein APHAL10511_002340 [Amanita phalloides]